MAEEGQQQEQLQESHEGEGGTPETDWKAEAAKWQALSKKHEDRAKQNAGAAKKLADIEAANLTAQEQAEARAKAAEERAAAAVHSVAAAELKAALTGLVDDPAADVADLNIGRFLGEDGQVDADKVAALKARYAARQPPSGPRAPAPNPAQGGSQPPRSLAEQVRDAEQSGDTRTAMRLKTQQLLGLRQQQG